MDINIKIDTYVYECLLDLAAKKKISLNLLIERYFVAILADNSGISKN